MVGFLKKWQKKFMIKRNLLELHNEMEKNLETFYVMEQRQFISGGFLNQASVLVGDLDVIKLNEAILIYVSKINDFNMSLTEFKKFEQWYASDLINKTPDNAKKLHVLKNALDQKLKDLEAIIIPAGQALERELLKLGIIRS